MSYNLYNDNIIKCLTVGNKAPDFSATSVVNTAFKEIHLSDYKGKFVVLFFYPLDFTLVCPTEIIGFQDRYKDFCNLDTEVLGVSVDSQFSHLNWIQTPREKGGIGKLDYPLISDLTKEISFKYGVLTNNMMSTRGLFIIDAEGIVQHMTINNLSVGRNVDEVLRLIAAFKHVKLNPSEACPMNWNPGEKTLALK